MALQLYESQRAEFLALYGRRRVGKTFLIREYFQGEDIYFELIGQKDASLNEQLKHFAVAFSKCFLDGKYQLALPSSWSDALQELASEIDRRKPKKKAILFFDELPWLASRKSKFLQALEHFWNSWASGRKDVLVIVCGSAGSWILDKIVRNKRGLHNRLTRTIRLLPFTLAETEAYLRSQGVRLDKKQILEIYMVMGGIPHYLGQAKKGQSSAQAISSICFSTQGLLAGEFENLYSSLFENSDSYVNIVKALARKRRGLTREELLKEAQIATGGWASEVLEALEESGLGAVATTEGGWFHRPRSEKEQGAQIDLLIDREDNCITICEMKHSDSEFVIDKAYAQNLRNKRDVFKAVTGTKKTVFIAMITTCGTRDNKYCKELIDAQVTMDALFERLSTCP